MKDTTRAEKALTSAGAYAKRTNGITLSALGNRLQLAPPPQPQNSGDDSMKRKLLVATNVFVLSALVLSQSALAIATAKSPVAQQSGSTYTMKEAGVQFTLPKGWEVKATSDGVMVSRKEAADFAIVTISQMPADASALSLEQLFKVAWQGAIENQKDFKDIAKVGDVDKTPPNAALPSMDQVFTAVQGNTPVVAHISVIKGKRPVLFFGYSTASSSFDQDVMDMLQSLMYLD